jgi:hypothetical protein
MGKRELFHISVLILLLLLPACKENEDVTGTEDSSADQDLVENVGSHEDADDYNWDDSQAVIVKLQDNASTAGGSGVSISGNIVTITNAGYYSVSGTLTGGQLVINTDDKGTVKLLFNGINITYSSSSPVYVANAEKVVIKLADNTSNYITDGASYIFESGTDEPNAALFSKADLTIYGGGSLVVKGSYNDGIGSKDGLIIAGGNITVTAADDGIRGKDYLIVKDGTISVTSGGDGLKSDNSEDAGKGYVSVEGGNIKIISTGDAIDGAKDIVINDGILNLTSGGGSSRTASSAVSSKGLSGSVTVVINGGTAAISSADDAVHSNYSIEINGGELNISSGDDGIHADAVITINNGTINITKSYEGIESAAVIINDGEIHVTSSDDGINGAGGVDGSGGRFTQTGNYYLNINGGCIAVVATGDGLDINGSITMTGGTVLVHGPTNSANGALDYDTSFKITGGILVAAGSSGMAQAPGSGSEQYSVMVTFSKLKTANSIFHIQKSDGTDVITFAPSKTYQSIVISTPALINGAAYDVYLGGSSTGTAQDGLYTGGTYSGGTKSGSFTISASVTKLNI